MYQWFVINSSTGAVGKHEQAQSPMINGEFDSNLLLTGFSIIGPYDDSSPMPGAYQSAWDNLQAYLYQNGSFVDNPNWLTLQLQHAKDAQKALIESGLNTTLAGGFTSKTTGHKYVTTTNGQSNMQGDLKRFELDSTLAIVQFFTVDQGWQPHTYDQLKGAFLDGGLWKDAQYVRQTELKNQIDDPATDTVDKVQAINWSEATY